jgi:hypothetical protein
MVTVAENSAFTMDICAGADVDAMQAGITIVKKIIVPFSLDGLTAEERRNLTASMDEVRELNPDVVLACMYQDLQPEAARYLANNSWTPKIFIVVPDGAANWANVEDTVSDYVMGLSAVRNAKSLFLSIPRMLTDCVTVRLRQKLIGQPMD